MKASIVIVNWNSKEYLATCLRSLEKYENISNLQIIVVDGGSFDGCDSMLIADFPYVEFIQSSENIGFGRCNNLGVKLVESEYLLLLNPDTELNEPTLDKMIAFHKELPQAGILCPRLLLNDGSLQQSSVQAAPTPLNQAISSKFLQRLFPKSNLWGTYPAYYTNTPTPVEAVSGAFMFMYTRDFENIKGFDPLFFMYAEDMDLCFRTRKNKLINYHIPSISVIHHGGGCSSKEESSFSVIQIKIAIHQYLKKNHSLSAAVRFRMYTVVSSVIRLTILYLWMIANVIGKVSNIKTSASIKKWTHILRWSICLEKQYP
jgi:GT2 family glycosyltransferase